MQFCKRKRYCYVAARNQHKAHRLLKAVASFLFKTTNIQRKLKKAVKGSKIGYKSLKVFHLTEGQG